MEVCGIRERPILSLTHLSLFLSLLSDKLFSYSATAGRESNSETIKYCNVGNEKVRKRDRDTGLERQQGPGGAVLKL